ncbi:uncharacterized protein LOC144734860 isoform X2 [Lampetra planeri]
MSNSESDSDSSGWTLLSREGLDEECVGAKQRRQLGHSDSEEDGAETVPAHVARSQGNGFLEGKLREALDAGGEGCERVGETGLPDEATCTVERPPGPEEVKEDVNAEVGDEDKEEVRDEEDEVNKTNEKVGKASEPMGEEVEIVDENMGNVSGKVKLGEELSVEVSEKMMEEEEVSEVVSEVLSGSVSKKVNKEVKGEGSENMGKEARGEISKVVSEKVRGEVSEELSEELSGDVQAKVIEVSEKMEEVKMQRSEVVMEEVRGEMYKDMMEEMGEEMMEVSEEVSGSDDSDLFTLDPSALDEIPDPLAPSEASVEMPDSAAALEDPPHLPSTHSEASVEPVTWADGEDTFAGSLSIGGRFPFPLGRERAPLGAGSSTDEDQEKLIRCDDDEIRSGPTAPRLRRRLARRQLSTTLADGTVPATGGTVPGTGVPVTVLVPALALALIVALGLVIASNHGRGDRHGRALGGRAWVPVPGERRVASDADPATPRGRAIHCGGEAGGPRGRHRTGAGGRTGGGAGAGGRGPPAAGRGSPAPPGAAGGACGLRGHPRRARRGGRGAGGRGAALTPVGAALRGGARRGHRAREEEGGGGGGARARPPPPALRGRQELDEEARGAWGRAGGVRRKPGPRLGRPRDLGGRERGEGRGAARGRPAGAGARSGAGQQAERGRAAEDEGEGLAGPRGVRGPEGASPTGAGPQHEAHRAAQPVSRAAQAAELQGVAREATAPLRPARGRSGDRARAPALWP